MSWDIKVLLTRVMERWNHELEGVGIPKDLSQQRYHISPGLSTFRLLWERETSTSFEPLLLRVSVTHTQS